MDNFLEYFRLGELSYGTYVFLIYFFGFVGGYCAGRAHAAWITLSNFIKANS